MPTIPVYQLRSNATDATLEAHTWNTAVQTAEEHMRKMHTAGPFNPKTDGAWTRSIPFTVLAKNMHGQEIRSQLYHLHVDRDKPVCNDLVGHNWHTCTLDGAYKTPTIVAACTRCGLVSVAQPRAVGGGGSVDDADS